eukprot:3331652-Amphidinium_carterae.1
MGGSTHVYARRSTTGQVVMYGRHCIKSSSTVQEPIGLSSGESEFYACVRGAAILLGLRALAEDWKLDLGLKLKVRTDSSAAKGSQPVEVRTQEQPADLLTKAAAPKVRGMAFSAIGLE